MDQCTSASDDWDVLLQVLVAFGGMALIAVFIIGAIVWLANR